ncbi:monocarboxylate transporter 13-like [Seriola lalandi dorsalis]|uniref:Monocarboxylate transporter 13 n=1 Tax=Seriola lalandi dorsalis TaxID=1841481 RepID=A0A3B4X4S9_SERLL|nr:monocarboxylate transporter 13-like [Seriola lalandi dorsalis]XP_023276930.1 monocarboxylate transporter 13-like [Seriola lalandi dorsalis]XP_023276931.1 monocarboxylate transporter 13-like [Seriola lalandi dorsalis]XP_023276932.1 monocarboxylate transporter 13-like [Seriola lalandi dorsalis]XP_056231523.1 monocarboxylate transporter 13 [Seriola aureovittata]XP_056231524.1 monocarboxylate transporter 13 [Seriola aureovittata]XP_056231525.1 monocarboxylate transporter 13 [Seriola aureovitta
MKMKSTRAGPPDGGYGWVVVMSAFFIMGLTAAVLKNFGFFFLDIQSHFGVLTSTTSWVTSTTIAMFHLGAPVASALTLQFSQRVVIIIGGLLTASGMLLASLDLSLPCLYLTMGILQGTGISFSWIPATSMVSHYFLRWRPIAYAIASSGECVFAVMFSPFFQWLIETYSWQGALLIIGGLQLNLCVCGALMRPLETKQGSIQKAKDSLEDSPTKGKVIFQFSLLRKPELLLYILFAIFAAAGFFIPPLFLVPFANSLGMDKYWPASILSVLALADLAGRLICGWVANMRLLRNLQLLTMVVTLLGVVLMLLPVSHNYWAILGFASLYGFLFGCVVAIHVTSIVDIVTLEGFDSGLGLFMLFRSIGGFIGPPAAGWLVDETNDYSTAFYLSGLCLISSAVFVVLVDRLVQRRKAVEADAHQAIGQQEDWETGQVK